MASEETDSSPVHYFLYFLYLLHLRFPIMNITDWRRRMDEIDKKLVELLNERSQCALEVGKLKQAAGMPIYQPSRENEVLANAARNNQGPLSNAAIRRLFERIIDEARSAERMAMHGDPPDEEKDAK